MNRNRIMNLLASACACPVLAGCATNRSRAQMFAPGNKKTGGHLIVNRAANFGSRVDLGVSVDGVHVTYVCQESQSILDCLGRDVDKRAPLATVGLHTYSWASSEETQMTPERPI